jgi:hypothetical protein
MTLAYRRTAFFITEYLQWIHHFVNVLYRHLFADGQASHIWMAGLF